MKLWKLCFPNVISGFFANRSETESEKNWDFGRNWAFFGRNWEIFAKLKNTKFFNFELVFSKVKRGEIAFLWTLKRQIFAVLNNFQAFYVKFERFSSKKELKIFKFSEEFGKFFWNWGIFKKLRFPFRKLRIYSKTEPKILRKLRNTKNRKRTVDEILQKKACSPSRKTPYPF